MKKILVIIALVIFNINQVYALDSSGVIYDNIGSGQASTNVNDALNDLYSKLNQKQEEINNINNIGTAGANHILKGYTAYVKGKTVTGTIASKGAATYTPNTKDQTIALGNYLSGVQTIKGDANLIAGNIVTGKSIFGVTGTYTSDANAVAGNILSGKTAYVNGSKITGTIPSKGAATYTPNTKDQTIASGNYLSGIQTIKGDANLVAANIAKGKTIFGVTGSYTSDANAIAANILSGKTAYVNGSKITGSIVSKGAATYTPGAVNQTITAGNYLSGVQTIKGDANLVAANIAKGKSIFGVSGTYTSDATATASDIASGKTAYVNGSKITGTGENSGFGITNSVVTLSDGSSPSIVVGKRSDSSVVSTLLTGTELRATSYTTELIGIDYSVTKVGNFTIKFKKDCTLTGITEINTVYDNTFFASGSVLSWPLAVRVIFFIVAK